MQDHAEKKLIFSLIHITAIQKRAHANNFAYLYFFSLDIHILLVQEE